jgi:PIN domain nuclease of toxin-antitoxin system
MRRILIISDLSHRIGLKLCDRNFNLIITQALGNSWTRDPFDRIITANASLNNNILLTKDQNILDNYREAKW